MKKIIILFGTIVVIVFWVGVSLIWDQTEDIVEEEIVSEEIIGHPDIIEEGLTTHGPKIDSAKDILVADESQLAVDAIFTIDEGYRIDYASNPRIMSYEDGILALGYEYNTPELRNAPSERGYISFSEDGVEFYGERRFEAGESMGSGIELPDGTWRRYSPNLNEGYIYSESSTDGGETWVTDEGYRYDLNEHDEGYMGVWTFFVDKDGGVVLIYNNDFEVNGEMVIFVRRAYSEPGDNGMNFTLTHENLLEVEHADGQQMSFADPNAIVLSDGRVRLIVMHQTRGEPVPPGGRVGTLYSFISEDGEEFEFENELVDWSDFEEWEVWSLNDPKIIQLDEGIYRIYVAALIVDEAESTEDNVVFKYVMASLSTWLE